jgi:hypothetical protein
MNILYVIYRYQKIKAMKPDERKKKVVPRAGNLMSLAMYVYY